MVGGPRAKVVTILGELAQSLSRVLCHSPRRCRSRSARGSTPLRGRGGCSGGSARARDQPRVEEAQEGGVGSPPAAATTLPARRDHWPAARSPNTKTLSAGPDVAMKRGRGRSTAHSNKRCALEQALHARTSAAPSTTGFLVRRSPTSRPSLTSSQGLASPLSSSVKAILRHCGVQPVPTMGMAPTSGHRPTTSAPGS